MFQSGIYYKGTHYTIKSAKFILIEFFIIRRRVEIKKKKKEQTVELIFKVLAGNFQNFFRKIFSSFKLQFMDLL